MATNMMGLTNDYTVRPQTIPLEQLMLHSELRMNKAEFCARDAQVEIFNRGAAELVMRLNAYVTAQNVEKEMSVTATVERYRTWWDMFKATYFPKFLLKYFPADFREFSRTETKRFKASVCYPDLVFPKERSYVIWRNDL